MSNTDNMQDEGEQAGERGDVCNNRWRAEERKNAPRMVG